MYEKNKWGGATGFPFMPKRKAHLWPSGGSIQICINPKLSNSLCWCQTRQCFCHCSRHCFYFVGVKKQARNVSWTEQATQGTLVSKGVIKFTETFSHNRDQKCRSEMCVKRSMQGKFFLAASRSAASRSSVSILHMGMLHDLCISTAITNSTYVGMLFRLLSKYRLSPDVSPIFTG